MFVFGFAGSVFYTLSLAVYYVAVIKCNKKEKDISNKLLEYIIHLVPNGYAIFVSVFLAAKRQYGPLPEGHACFLGVHPRNCLTDPDVECERGSEMILEYAKWLGVLPFLLVYLLVFCIMMTVCHHIITQKRRTDRWRMQTDERDQSGLCCCFMQRQKSEAIQEESNGELTSSLSPAQKKFLKMQKALSKTSNTSDTNTSIPLGAGASRSGTKQDPLAFNVHQVKKKIRRESMLAHNAPIILSTIISNDRPLRSSHNNSRRRVIASREEKMAITQCMLYVSSFLLCWIFNLIARIIQITGNPLPFAVLVLSRFFNPLQGFFFILVYSRPHVKSIQNSNPELNWFQACVIAFKAGGDNDFGNNQMEVVDEEGIDAPRLPDSERERRQEIVRQQYKRTVSYRSSCLRSSIHTGPGFSGDVSIIDDTVADGNIKEFESERSTALNDNDVEAKISSKKDEEKVDEIVV